MAIKRILDKVEKQKQLLDGFWVHPFFNPLPSTILWSQIINGLISAPILLTIQHCLGWEWRGCVSLLISLFRSQHFWSPLYQWGIAVHHGKLISFLNIFLPLEILLKTVFCSYSWAVFWSLSCHRELKLTTKPFTGCTLCARCKILACEVWACTESKILR